MRARILKPDLFRDEQLADLPIEARFLFMGLWGLADREGRLEDRPRRIRADLFPYDDYTTEMVDQWLTMLCQHWITRYVADGVAVIQIINFQKHQRCHPNEPKSVLPIAPLVNHAKPLVNRSATNVIPNCPEAEAVSIAEAVSPLTGGVGGVVFQLAPPSANGSAAKAALTRQQNIWFDEFYAAYWLKKGKDDARRAYLKAVRSADLHQQIMRAVSEQTSEMLTREPSKRPYPATWLNGKRWEDEIRSAPAESEFYDGYEITGRPRCQ